MDGRSSPALSVPTAVPPPALAAEAIHKAYGGTAALSGADLTLRTNSIHALLGENGAGKSTLVRVLSGVEQADSGNLRFDGKQAPAPFNAEAALQAGVATIHQHRSLMPDMSVAENVALVAGYVRKGRQIDWKSTKRAAVAALDRIGASVPIEAPVRSLSVAQQSLVKIARAMALQTKILILDEPTASLEATEVENLYKILTSLRDEGHAILVVTHRLDEVLEYADVTTILRDGQTVRSGLVKEQSIHTIIDDIVGSESNGSAGRGRTESGTAPGPGGHLAEVRSYPDHGPATVLNIRNTRTRLITIPEIRVSSAQIVGCYGLMGSGYDKVPRMLLGVDPVISGEIFLADEPYRPTTPKEAVRRGISYVPGDRTLEGVFEGLKAFENIFPAHQGPWYKFCSAKHDRIRSAAIFENFDIRPRNTQLEIERFSGGNAQKIVMSRALDTTPKLLLLEEPTAGVDINARRQLHDAVRTSRDAGCAVVLSSSDVEEIVALADVVVVFIAGRLVSTLYGSDIRQEVLLHAANAGTVPSSELSETPPRNRPEEHCHA